MVSTISTEHAGSYPGYWVIQNMQRSVSESLIRMLPMQCYPVLSGESGRARGGRRLLDFMRRDTTGGGGGGGGKDRGQMVGADGGGGGGKKQAEAGPVKTGRVRARTVWPAPLTRLSKASRRWRWRWRRETNGGGA